MPVISFVTQKGGSGKTTLAINCAVVASQSRGRVLLLDMDPQGSAVAWYLRREAEERPQVVRGTAAELGKVAELVRTHQFEWILIDTPGRDDATTAAAINASDFCVIPSRPSVMDLEAIGPTVETVRRLGKPAAFVLTQTPPRSYRIGEAEEVLSRTGDILLCPENVVLRNVYQDAHTAGLGVMEMEPDGKAAEEMKDIWRWVSSRAKRVKHAAA